MTRDEEIKVLESLRIFEDSQEVSDGVWHAADTYWNKEAATHIFGLYDTAKRLANIVRKYHGTDKH